MSQEKQDVIEENNWREALDNFIPTVATTLDEEIDRKESEFERYQRKLNMQTKKGGAVKVGNRYVLSATQKEYAELLIANDVCDVKRTQKEMAEMLGVSTATLRNWRQQKIFVNHLNELADTYVSSHIAEAYNELLEIMRSGKNAEKLRAIELLLKKEGKLKDKTEITVEDKKEQSIDDILAEIDTL